MLSTLGTVVTLLTQRNIGLCQKKLVYLLPLTFYKPDQCVKLQEAEVGFQKQGDKTSQ